jgi:hypothetical protein
VKKVAFRLGVIASAVAALVLAGGAARGIK